MRSYRSLAGKWQFQLDPDGLLTIDTLAPDREISVPMPWQAASPEGYPALREYSGYAWYRRSVDLSQEWLDGELLLHFGAVDYWCQLFVNGHLAGEHEGGYTPFDIPIKQYARPGANEIAVRVYDPVQGSIVTPRWPRPVAGSETPQATRNSQLATRNSASPPFDAEEIPHGKQEWYINVGGIWQDVSLVALPPTYLDNVSIVTNIETGEALLTVDMGGAPLPDSSGVLRVSVLAEGREVAAASNPLAGGQTTFRCKVRVENPRLWSPDDPYLYNARFTLEAGGRQDELSVRFGFREISTRNGQIILNGEPIFLLCALDQDLYPDTIYTVPSEEFLRDQFRKAKHLGLNSLRCHIKPPDRRYLDLADEMGLLIWAEIPSWRTFQIKSTLYPEQLELGDAAKRRVEQTLEEMVRRDFNHPSLVIWTIVNEDWGTSLPLSAADRAWLVHMYERCKELDPTRLVVDNSPCSHAWGPNIHVRSDLDDFHIYANIPDQAKSFAHTIEQFSLRPVWSYSSHGDSHRSGDEPLVLSEFGNWGLPSLRSLRAHHGGEPPWFDIGAWWSPWEGEPGWPHGVEERFDRLGLRAIWDDYEAFATATQWHQFAAMKFEIEAMRRHASLAGYVITEFTDAYWESNGLLDFVRNPKAYHDHFASINSPDMVVPCPTRYAFWDDQEANVQLFVSHYSPADWSGARLSWTVNPVTSPKSRVPSPESATGTMDSGLWTRDGEPDALALKRGETRLAGVVSVSLPTVDETQTIQVRFTLRDAGGQVLARNNLDLLVLPSAWRQPGYTGQVAVITHGSEFSPEMAEPPALPIGDDAEAEEMPLDDPLPEYVINSSSRVPMLERVISQIGYRVSGRLAPDTELAITDFPTRELLEWVRAGGNLLFISSGASPFFWVQHRSGSYSGSWITSFSWLRRVAHRRLDVTNPLGLPFMHVMPRGTMLGIPVEDPRYQPDLLSGMVLGWVRHPAVHTVQFRYGQGKVIMTTFALEAALLDDDPVAVALCHDLVEYLSSDDCRPQLQL
jgi:hypothetical protein